jgi:hypothetical protein
MDTELTEFSDLDADELHLVKRAATGFPALLAKSVAAEIEAARSPVEKPRKTKNLPKSVRQQVEARRKYLADPHQETTTVKEPSKATVRSLRKSAKRTVAKTAARRALSNQVIKAESDALQHIRQLEREVAAKGSGQDAWGAAFLLNRAKMDALALERVRKAAVPSMDNFASLDNYMGNPSPAAAGAASSRASTARAVAGVQGAPINARRSAPRDALMAVFDGDPETVQSYEVQVKKFAKALADAETPQQREAAGYALTRARLMLGHLRGEI